ncbi:MAG TPA: NYN domain-containing protein [Thermoanaerobaculales bacterium]|nr:NYN domain-containing protein [Thermoanaerobaculales bacterium]HPA80553.1 NYN domain-containing protein [Thermoanaerobaculales bacterium]HQL29359.1 NYN domain-containing protein [Thermoanaerobaculales bacterium]HQN96041.1 NYN domain-containing protein [Thermoanaerobaculales bacterium]HQP43069.1 NYN domain-containing protein [Thermoanaerobaculales bacterium]
MPLLVDGTNLLHSLPRSARSRPAVRALVLEATRHERMSVVVVFDGPPAAGAPAQEALGRVTIVHSGAASADDVIISRIPAGRRAREWVVVTDDRGLAGRARERGATVRTLAEWSTRPRPTPPRARAEAKLSSSEVAAWQEVFTRGRKDDS